MSSRTKRVKFIRTRKKAPNKVNLKANAKRVQENAETLRKLASGSQS